ncbi:MAG: response regulator [Candidatus Sumerlaeaceae bacterium]
MTSAPHIRVLVVDDDPDVRLIVSHALSKHFEVITCASGVEALERIDRYEPDFIVMDVMMPVLTGIDAVRAIKKDARFAHVPVVFLTGRSDNEAVREAMGAGGDYYLQKPFDPQDLLELVGQMVKQHCIVPRQKRFSLDELVANSPYRECVMGAREEGEEKPTPARGEEEPVSQPHRPLTPSTSRRVRVMIIDDDVDVVNYVKSILREDYEIIGISDSELAPEKIVAYQPDILLLDIVMPKLNGFHLSHLIRINRRLRGSKIIFVSSRTDHEAIAKAFTLGASDYLEKPFTPEQLRRKIHTVTQHPDFICPKKRLSYMEILRREGEL